MEYYKPLHMLVFTPLELGQLWRTSMLKEVWTEMNKKGYSSFDITLDKNKLDNITNLVVAKRCKQKEDVEIFIAISSCLAFFKEDNGKIGFPLSDSITPKKTPIRTLENLKAVCKENHLTDFAFFCSNNVYEFQLKQYTQEITTEKLLDEMIRKIKSYGYKLGTTNIVFHLQGNGPAFSTYEIDFKKIHKKINTIIDLSTIGHVYIQYNDQNKHIVMIEVYPKLIESKVIFTPNDLDCVFEEK